MIEYSEIADLRSIYLEDSWVLAIEAHPAAVRFAIEFVLREDHPAFSPPAPGLQYCYRRGALEFTGVRQLSWVDQQQRPGTDATGEKDWGNIDSMRWEADRFQLQGGWGEMKLQASRLSITFDN